MAKGSYTIRKYSYFLVDGIQYTVDEDFSFEKINDGDEIISSINDNLILYQGTVGQYPSYIAEGVEFETLPIVIDNLTNTNDTKFISHGNITVYVKDYDNGTWSLYEEVDNLYLAGSLSKVYDLRLNENGHFEIKFGNGVFGKKLKQNDEVSVFYILSDGEKGLISKNSINGNKLFVYNNKKLSEIYNDIEPLETYLTSDQSSNLLFSNTANSTLLKEAETVDEIRENAPSFLSSQLRLVTESDYEKFFKKSIPNVLKSIKIVNNTTFITEYIDYFYKLCVDPNKVNRVIINQVNFADSCDYNNVNVFLVPYFNTKSIEVYPPFLNNSFKNLIKDLTKDKKMMGHEIVPRDPVYMAVDLGFGNNVTSFDVKDVTRLVVIKEKNDKSNADILKSKISDVIVDYFHNNSELGQYIDLGALTSDILSIKGVKSIKTQNTTEAISFNGLSLVSWNPVFDNSDVNIINQSTRLPFFKYPYLFSPNTIVNKIDIIDNE